MSAHQQVEPGHAGVSWPRKDSSASSYVTRREPKFSLTTIFSRCTEERSIVNSKLFQRFLAIEKKRAERSRTSFMLVVLNVKNLVQVQSERKSLAPMEQAVFSAIRNTDFVGWYDESETSLGIVFTEIAEPTKGIASTIIDRVRLALSTYISARVLSSIDYTCQVYQPELTDSRSVERRAIACD
jgi:hypothetical protein